MNIQTYAGHARSTFVLLLTLTAACSGGDDDASAPDGGRDSIDAADHGCGPSTCDGCCDGDTCLGGDSTGACGTGGEACEVCGAGLECQARACEVLANSRWDLTVVSATINELNLDGEDWDSGLEDPPPDVHVDVWVGEGEAEQEATTDTVHNSLTPTFDEVVLTEVTASDLLDRLEMRPMDTDEGNDDDIIGRCSAEVDTSSFSGAELTLDCPRDLEHDQAGFAIRYRISPH